MHPDTIPRLPVLGEAGAAAGRVDACLRAATVAEAVGMQIQVAAVVQRVHASVSFADLVAVLIHRRMDVPVVGSTGGIVLEILVHGHSGAVDTAERPSLRSCRDRFALVCRAVSSDQCLVGRASTSKPDEHELGMDRPITPRDFLNGVGIAVTGSLLGTNWLAG